MIQYYKTFRLFGFLIYLTLRVSDDGYLADEHAGDVTIPTQVIEFNQNFLQAD
jgi:hypothetical protein